MRIVHALIRVENTASMRAFEKAGFVGVGFETVKGYQAKHYVYDASSDRR